MDAALARRDPLVVVGIDPGTRVMGFGVVARRRGALLRVDHGVFRTDPTVPMPNRLLGLFRDVRALLAHHKPDLVSIEQAFFSKNPQSAFRIGEARAVVLVAAAEAGLAVLEYPTAVAKRSVTGHGRADKADVQEMIARLLGLATLPEPHDAADALALAVCALHDPRLDARFHGAAAGSGG